MTRRVNRLLLRVGALAIILVLWMLATAYVGSRILPGPVVVFKAAFDLAVSGAAFQPFWITLTRTFWAFVFGMVTGTAYGILVVNYRTFNDLTLPMFTVTVFAPTLVVIFAGVLMLGIGGLLPIVLIVGSLVFPNVALGMRDAFRDMDEDLNTMADSFKVHGIRRWTGIYLPSLTPAFLSISRIAMSISVKVVVLTEVFGFPDGVGFKILFSYLSFDIEHVLAWLVLFVVVLLIIEQGVRLAERTVVRWQ